MSRLAGSAISQGPLVGRIDRWSEWRPTDKEPLWLLLSGATDPPKEIGISKRRTRDVQGDRNGAFLAGVTRDLVNMEDVVGTKLFNTVKDLYLTKKAALRHITRLFEKCQQKKAHPMLYYTGHGEIGTGNWCFADGTISIQEIFDKVPVDCIYPMIFSDACYSGHWANFCLNKGIPGFHCLAACPEYSTALDTKGVYVQHTFQRLPLTRALCLLKPEFSWTSIDCFHGSLTRSDKEGSLIAELKRAKNNFE